MKSWLKFFETEEITPAYVFDISDLKKKIENLKSIFNESGKNVTICYAMKANPFLIDPLDCLVDKYEVCSPGELNICRKRKIDMSKVVFSGVNKQKKDIQTALESGVGVCTVESVAHLDKIQLCAQNMDVITKVILRVTSGNQFGMDWAVVKDIIRNRDKYENVCIQGIQFYSGTQKKPEKIKDEIDMLIGYDNELLDIGFKMKILEYGPGINVEYYNDSVDDDILLNEFKELLLNIRDDLDIVLEMGRFIAAECGYYITKTVEVKCNEGQRYCLIDGGINHINYYGQVMGARKPPFSIYRNIDGKITEITNNKSDEKWIICGSLCTVADVLVRNLCIEEPKENDIFVFKKIGAYSVTEGIYLFLSRDLPKIYFFENDKLTLVRDSLETNILNCIRN